jgi:hypothetical protein
MEPFSPGWLQRLSFGDYPAVADLMQRDITR